MSGGDDRRSVEIGGDSGTPVGPGSASSFDATTIDFGHHAGRTIEEPARIDPDDLTWLARHPSGARYRTEINRVISSAAPHPGDWQR